MIITLKGGQKQILSIATDVCAEERQVTMIEFDRQGNAIEVLNYNHKQYEK